MGLPEPDSAYYPTEAEIRDGILRTIRLGNLRANRTVNVLPGSDYFYTATAYARIAALAFANSRIELRNTTPKTATGQALIDLANVYGVFERPPTGAAGYATVTGAGVVPAKYACVAPNGSRYETVSVETVTDGDPILISATSTGESTNQPQGTILRWESAAVGTLGPTITVATGGLDGGADGDTSETLRRRLIDRLSTPGAGGNWSQFRTWAEEASAAVDAAYVYQAVRGPGSVDVAIMGAAGDKVLGAASISSVASHVAAQMPAYASLNVTSVVLEYFDATVAIELPYPTYAGGAGGGWRDGVPWPGDDARIAAVAGATVDVETVAAPVLGASVALWNPAAAEMAEFTIVTAPSTIAGGYRFDIAPTNGSLLPDWIVAGMYFSAGSVNLKDYAKTLYDELLKLGPGEKSNDADVVPRALRKPPPDAENPIAISSLALAAVTSAHSEILSAEWGVRRASGTTTALTSPSVPSDPALAPRVLAVRHLAFRKA